MLGRKKSTQRIIEKIKPDADFLIQKLYEVGYRIKHEWVSPLEPKPNYRSNTIEIQGYRREDPEFQELRALIDNWSMAKWEIRKAKLINQQLELKLELRKLL